MAREAGLRDRKKVQTRHRLADVAARLFAEYGYDAVSISDVARAADVSDQTVYNYFPTKPDLVLDRDEEIRERYGQVMMERAEGVTPADALRALLHEDIARYHDADFSMARGEFPAQCLTSPVLRRFALESRNRQAETVAEAISATRPELHPIVVRAHAAALISVFQTITARIGSSVLDGSNRDDAATGMHKDADIALDDLQEHFLALVARTQATTMTRP
jgi:AcrR family transcriptional regulator